MDILRIEYPTAYKLMAVFLTDGTEIHVLPELGGHGWFVIWYPPTGSGGRGGSWQHCDDNDAITIIRRLLDQEEIGPHFRS